MGITAAGGASERRSSRNRKTPRMVRNAYVSEINVTPMVDVMLVLLIVFMVAAPLMTTGIAVHLPSVNAQRMEDKKEPTSLSLTDKGEIFLNKNKITLSLLPAALDELTKSSGKDVQVLVRADQALDYGTVVKVMGLLSKAGITKVGLVTKEMQQNPS